MRHLFRVCDPYCASALLWHGLEVPDPVVGRGVVVDQETLGAVTLNANVAVEVLDKKRKGLNFRKNDEGGLR